MSTPRRGRRRWDGWGFEGQGFEPPEGMLDWLRERLGPTEPLPALEALPELAAPDDENHRVQHLHRPFERSGITTDFDGASVNFPMAELVERAEVPSPSAGPERKRPLQGLGPGMLSPEET